MCGQQKIKWCHFAVMLRMDKAVLVCQFVIKCNCGVSISIFLCSLSFHMFLTTTIVLGWQVAKPHTIYVMLSYWYIAQHAKMCHSLGVVTTIFITEFVKIFIWIYVRFFLSTSA